MVFNDETLAYCEAHTTPEPPILARIDRETHLTQVSPQMLSGHLQGTLLRMIVQMVRPARILEIGTFTGYSALSMALGFDSGEQPDRPSEPRLHTIESNPELEERIRDYLREAGMENRVILHTGRATDVIPTLNEAWDLVFLDADKAGYPEYYDLILPRMRPGGFLLADNVLWNGAVVAPSRNPDRDTLGILAFNQRVVSDDRVEKLLLPFRDGLYIIRKR